MMVLPNTPVKTSPPDRVRLVSAALICALFFFTMPVSSQVDPGWLSDRVGIAQSSGTVGDVIRQLTEDHGLVFSYNPVAIPLHRSVPELSRDMTLGDLFNLTFARNGIKYTFYDEVIILSLLKKYTVNGFVENRETGEKLTRTTLRAARNTVLT